MHLSQNLDGFLPYQSSQAGLLPRLDLRNRAACGLFSMHHAMVFLGLGGSYCALRDQHPSLYSKIYGGTVAQQLVALARKMSLRATALETRSIRTYRKQVDRALRMGAPVIIGSEPAIHWLCLGGRTDGGGYVWADSANANGAIGAFACWEEVEAWLTLEDGLPIDLQEDFSAITLEPGARMPKSRSMVPWSGGLYSCLSADPAYAWDWSNQLADMLDVFWDKEVTPKGLPAADFLASHLKGIVEATSSLTGHSKSDLLTVAHQYRNAADFHNLVVARGHETLSIAAFAHKLAAKVALNP